MPVSDWLSVFSYSLPFPANHQGMIFLSNIHKIILKAREIYNIFSTLLYRTDEFFLKIKLKIMINRKKPVTVGFVALGCPKNIVDSERMLAEIAQSNCFITAEPYKADAVVINTCGFIEPAKQEAIAAIKKATMIQKEG